MESVKEIFKIGKGPSSSHTMAPKKAAEMFRNKYPEASSFVVTLYGSLAATGKGHLTDKAVEEPLSCIGANGIIPALEIVWLPKTFLPQHPNGMKFEAFDRGGAKIGDWVTFSIGGGDISDNGKRDDAKNIYPHSTMKDILSWCNENGTSFWEYVQIHEESDIWDYLSERWKV